VVAVDVSLGGLEAVSDAVLRFAYVPGEAGDGIGVVGHGLR